MNRFKAAGIHLLISILIVTSILVLMLNVWYPGNYFKLMGGQGLIFIMAGVDACLGPLLTLIVFKPKKKTLKSDLTTIAIIQIAALIYGMSVVFEARPVYTVFTQDQFQVAAAADISNEELEKASAQWKSLPVTGPVMVYASAPTDPKEKEEIMFAALAGMDWQQFPRLYHEYDLHITQVLQIAKPLSTLREIQERNNAEVDRFLSSQKRSVEDFVFLPIRSSREEMAIVLEKKDGKFVAILDATPWK